MANQPKLNIAQFVEEVQQQLGLDRSVIIPIFRKQHLEWVDNQHFSRGFEILEFAIFTSEDFCR